MNLEKEKIDTAYEFKRVYPDVFQSLFKACSRDLKKEMVKGLLPIINKAFTNKEDLDEIRYGLYYVDNIID